MLIAAVCPLCHPFHRRAPRPRLGGVFSRVKQKEEAPDWLANSPKGIRARSNCAEFYTFFARGTPWEEEAAAKKEKVEQCKKNLWGLPCTADGEVDRTAFGISRGGISWGVELGISEGP
eukprot:scaffold23000_cov63-Phaeocystis_antarctica.AAC.2